MPATEHDADIGVSLSGINLSVLSLLHRTREHGRGITCVLNMQRDLVARFLPENKPVPEGFLRHLDNKIQKLDLATPGPHTMKYQVRGQDSVTWQYSSQQIGLNDGVNFDLLFVDFITVKKDKNYCQELAAYPFPCLVLEKGIIRFANSLVKEIFGDFDIQGKVFIDLMDNASAALFEQIANNLLNGIVRDVEANFITPSGIRPCAVSIGSIKYNAENCDLIVLRDVSDQKRAEKFLREGELRYRSLTESMRDVVWILDRELCFTWVSDPVLDLLGYQPIELVGRRMLELVTYGSRSAAAAFEDFDSMQKLIRSSQGRVIIELEFMRNRGQPVWLEISMSDIQDASLGVAGYLGVARDISDRKFAQYQLGQSEEKFRKILERLPVPIIVMLHDWSIEKVNIKFSELFGWTRDEIPHFEVWWEKAFPDAQYRAEIRAQAMDVVGNAALNGRESQPFQIRVHCRDEEERIVECRFIFLIGHGIWVFNDITELHRKEERLNRYATTDEMTGIYNRRTGIAILQRAIDIAHARTSPLSICYLDVNNLKYANDTYGHGEGDSLILLIIQAIENQIRRSDTLCRMGGDEFLIIFPDCDKTQAQKIASAIVETVNEYNRQNLKPYTIGFSYGIEQFEKEQTLQEFVALADKSMYAEKRRFHSDEQ
jgi:diguanylate cyclase (GGDEF)-like protein/PAS domain S-box-containing protein